MPLSVLVSIGLLVSFLSLGKRRAMEAWAKTIASTSSIISYTVLHNNRSCFSGLPSLINAK